MLKLLQYGLMENYVQIYLNQIYKSLLNRGFYVSNYAINDTGVV